jgi:hypothetical protein
VKAQRSWSHFSLPILSFLHPTALDLDGNQGEWKRQPRRKMTPMDTRKIPISLLATAKKKATTYLFPSGERTKRAFRAASAEVAITVRGVAHVFRIIIFLRFAKDFPSILKLYGVESLSENG